VPQPSARSCYRRMFQSHGGRSLRLAPVSFNEILVDKLAVNSRVYEQSADELCYCSLIW
jgi:hypothetical protein